MITRVPSPSLVPLIPPAPDGDPGGAPARADVRAEETREAERAAGRDHVRAGARAAARDEATEAAAAPVRGEATGTMGLLLLAVVVVLYVGEAVFLPVAAAVLLYFLFAPLVRFAASWGIPRALSATVVLGVILSVIGLSIYGLAGPAGAWMKRLPHSVEKVGDKLQALRQPMEQVTAAAQQMADLSKPGARPAHGGGGRGDEATAATAATPAGAGTATGAQPDAAKDAKTPGPAAGDAQAAAAAPKTAPDADHGGEQQDQSAHDGDTVSEQASQSGGPAQPTPARHSWLGGSHSRDSSPAPKAARESEAPASGKGAEPSAISVTQPSLIAPYLLSGTFGVIGFLGELFITLVTLFFLLSTGGTLLNRAVVLIPALRRNPDPGMVYTAAPQTDAAAVLRESERHVGMYLRTTLMINAGLATVISGLFWAVGMPNPVLWGVMAGVLNFLPYVGPVIGVIVVLLAGLITFDTFAQAVVAPLIYVGCAFLEGNLLTPWIMGMRLALSPLAIFLWMMFWGFMWGAAGAIIAVPLLVMVREFCQRIESLNAVGRLIEP